MIIELKMNERMARETYSSASKEIKKILEALAPKGFFTMNIMDRVKTFKDARDIVKPSVNLSILLEYNGVDSDMIGAQAMAKLSIIARALNEGWTPDWKDSSQYKYSPYFKANSAGFGFSYTAYVYWYTNTDCGSRLCFKSSKLAEYAGKQFESIYNDFLTIK